MPRGDAHPGASYNGRQLIPRIWLNRAPARGHVPGDSVTIVAPGTAPSAEITRGRVTKAEMTNKTLNLLHLANHHSTNIGNGALVSGTERVLREDFATPPSFSEEAWDDYNFAPEKRFDRTFVDRVNAHDALLVGAAIAINGRRYLGNAGMRLDLPLELWPGIKRPVVFYGISYRCWPYQRYYHLDKFKAVVAYLLAAPNVLLSLRNDGTKAWLESTLGYRLDGIEEIPDPGLYVETESASHPQLDPGRKNIVIALNNEDEVFRFGGAPRELAWRLVGGHVEEATLVRLWRWMPDWRARRRRFVKRLAAAIERISAQWDANFILCPHYLDDFKIIGELFDVLAPKVAHQNVVSFGLLKVPHSAYFYDLYAKADLAISMRVHSMSPSIGVGTPMIALSTQPRLDVFMRDLGLGDHLLDTFDPDLTERLSGLAGRILSDPAPVRERFARTKGAMRAKTSAFNRKMEAFVNGKPGA